MLYIGKNITQSGDQLTPIEIAQLYGKLTQPDAELQSKITQLRTLATIDNSKYQQLKTTLPYVVCAHFTPPVRRSQNFASIGCFIIDVDHLIEKGFDLTTLRQRLAADSRVVLMFTSPSQNGLKILFRLEQKCYDTAQFSMFYKLFAEQLSLQYGLQQVIDRRTSDVTRACFLSYDADAYMNPDAEPVAMHNVVDFNDVFAIDEAQKTLDVFDNQAQQQQKDTSPAPLPDDVLAQIKQRLHPPKHPQHEKIIHVPQKLNDAMLLVGEQLKEYGVQLVEVADIHYGKKIRTQVEMRWAEVNLFLGKAGYRVVITPKRGSNNELAEITQNIIRQTLQI